MMNAHSADSRDEAMMSDAAAQALDELLEKRRDQVLSAARSASPDEVLTAADVVRAYYLSEERRPSPAATSSLAPRRGGSWWWVADATTTILLTLIVTLLAFKQAISPEGVTSLEVAQLTPLVLGALAIALMLSTRFLKRVAYVYTWKRWGRFVAKHAVMKPGSLLLSSSGALTINEVGDEVSFLHEWSKVEDRLRRLANSVKVEGRQSPGRQPIGEVIGVLLVHRVVDNDFSADLRKVVRVRNLVAHGEPVTREQLEEGLSLLHSVEERLAKLQHDINPKA